MDDEYDDDEEDNDRDFYEEEDEVVSKPLLLQSYQKWLILVLTKHLCYVLCSLWGW